MLGEYLGDVPFHAHVELLRTFLSARDEILERLQSLLNAQRKPAEYLQDGAALSRHFEDCFFAVAGLTKDQIRLRGRLQGIHWASGFRPRVMPGMHNDLVDPAQLMIRGFYLWQQTRWPGRSGRVYYAHTLFNVYLLRSLELLSMRVWDTGSSSAGDRLFQVQGVLDSLWKISPADQPVFVRDARWLIPLAQSPTTDDLTPYFEILERIAHTLREDDRIEIHRAAVVMAGGHLRSQLRHHSLKDRVPLDDPSLVLSSRNSNALDFAVLIAGLVTLLEAYEHTLLGGDAHRRLQLADAICQGISADPDLFVNRIELLSSYSMIEHLFIAIDHADHAAYTPIGRRHVELLQTYRGLVSRLSKSLHDDCVNFRPVEGRYSPYGLIYGFSSNLTEHMALKSLQPDTATRFSLEDVFTAGNSDKLGWVSGWRKLPHISAEMQRLFEYPQQFADSIFARLERALHESTSKDKANLAHQPGRLVIASGGAGDADSKASMAPHLPARYVRSSDVQMVAANQAHADDQARLMHDRQEGMFIVSYGTPGGWTAVTKDILTEIIGAGHDATMVELPSAAAEALRLMCPGLSVLPRID